MEDFDIDFGCADLCSSFIRSDSLSLGVHHLDVLMGNESLFVSLGPQNDGRPGSNVSCLATMN